MSRECDRACDATTRIAPEPAVGGPMPDRGILSASGITKTFTGVTALWDVHFELRAGEVHALMGENRAGKSTLMKIFSGVHPQYEGSVRIAGEEVIFGSVRDAEAAVIAISPQEHKLVPELSVAATIFPGREPLLAGLVGDRRKSVAAARALLNRLGIDLDPEARIASLRVGE